jgi:hypothetical protein
MRGSSSRLEHRHLHDFGTRVGGVHGNSVRPETGKAIYGNVLFRFLYVERSRYPAAFWCLVVFYWIAAIMAVVHLALPQVY